MRALVTGAGGLIGANLVRELLMRGVAVRAMVRGSSRLDALADVAVERVIGDVLHTPEKLAPVFEGCDTVFHAAAYFTYAGMSDDAVENTAVSGTRNILAAAALAGVRRVIVTSSSVVFGSSHRPESRDERAPQALVSSDGFIEPGYAVSKVRQDAAAAAVGRALGLEVLFACPTLSVGPFGTTLGPSNGVIVGYLADPIRMTYPGGCNIVSVRDVAAGHWLIATRGVPGEHYLLGGENLTWQQIHTMIAELCGVEPPRICINHTLAISAAALEEVLARVQKRSPLTTRNQARMVGRYYWYSHAKAAALGYQPAAARRALADACAWLAASEHISRGVRATMRLSEDVFAARRLLRNSSLSDLATSSQQMDQGPTGC